MAASDDDVRRLLAELERLRDGRPGANEEEPLRADVDLLAGTQLALGFGAGIDAAIALVRRLLAPSEMD
jgi:hypothetical protein